MKDGTAAASPSAPSMTRNSDVYELALAYVNVAANATSVTVTDKRSDSGVCGWAAVAQAISGTYEAMIDDIKTGFDGVVYQSPGDAVRGCDEKLNGEISDIKNVVDYVNWLFKYYPLFEAKAWNATQQAFVNSTAQMSLTTIQQTDTDIILRVKSGGRYQVHSWASASAAAPSSITGWQTGAYTIKAGTYFTIGFNNQSGTTNMSTLKQYLYADSIETVDEKLDDFINASSLDALYPYYGAFEQKRYDTTNHVWVASTFTLSNIVPIKLNKDITVRAKSGYQYIILFWASTDTSSGFTGNSGTRSTPYTIAKDTYFTISATKIGGGTITDIKSIIYCDRIEDTEDSQDLDIRTSNLYASFAQVGVIGDSYSAVRLYYYDQNDHLQSAGDVPFYSWGKFMERNSKMLYRIFAKGGLEASQWMTDTDAGFPVASQTENLCQCYIIGLGINDSSRHYASYIGTTADINISNPDLNANSFIGNYAKIIQKMSALVDGAKFFVMTMGYYTSTTNQNTYSAYNDAIREIANYFDNVYLIDLNARYFDQYSDANGFFAKNTVNGHFTPAAYQYVAELVSYEMSRIMYANPDDFKLIEFINRTDGTYWTNGAENETP